jgi:hypothetical protein
VPQFVEKTCPLVEVTVGIIDPSVEGCEVQPIVHPTATRVELHVVHLKYVDDEPRLDAPFVNAEVGYLVSVAPGLVVLNLEVLRKDPRAEGIVDPDELGRIDRWEVGEIPRVGDGFGGFTEF